MLHVTAVFGAVRVRDGRSRDDGEVGGGGRRAGLPGGVAGRDADPSPASWPGPGVDQVQLCAVPGKAGAPGDRGEARAAVRGDGDVDRRDPDVVRGRPLDRVGRSPCRGARHRSARRGRRSAAWRRRPSPRSSTRRTSPSCRPRPPTSPGSSTWCSAVSPVRRTACAVRRAESDTRQVEARGSGPEPHDRRRRARPSPTGRWRSFAADPTETETLEMTGGVVSLP